MPYTPRTPRLPPLSACLADAEGPDPSAWRPDGDPLVRLPRAALDGLVASAGPGFGALAMLMRDEAYSLAVFVAGGPGLAEVPDPFVAVLSDRDPGIRLPPMFEVDTVQRLALAAAAVVFTAHDDDDAAMLAGLATVRPRRGSLLVVDAADGRVPAWLDALGWMRPGFPLLAAGAFARPSALN